MDKYSRRLVFRYNSTHTFDDLHFEDDGHGHHDEYTHDMVLDQRKRFLVIGGYILSAMCVIGVLFMLVTHKLSKRKWKRMMKKYKSNVCLEQYPDTINDNKRYPSSMSDCPPTIRIQNGEDRPSSVPDCPTINIQNSDLHRSTMSDYITMKDKEHFQNDNSMVSSSTALVEMTPLTTMTDEY